MKLPFYIKFCIILLLSALVLFFLEQGQEFFIPLVIAILLSFILLPLAIQLEAFRLPRWVASLVSVFLGLIVFGGFIYFLFTQIQSLGSDLPLLKDSIVQKIHEIQKWIGYNFSVSEEDQIKWLNKKVADTLNAGDQYLIALFATTGIFIANIILIPLYVYFLILYRDKVKEFISLISHNGEEKKAFLITHKIARLSQKYLKGLLTDLSIVTVLLSIVFALFGIKHAILFAVLVSVLNIVIPYMGITLGSIFPFLMAMITLDSPGSAFGVIATCVSIQFIDNHFINPYIVGSSVSLNPLTALVALVIGALVWGLYGMLLCIPVMGMIKVVCDNVDFLRPYGFIIGHEWTYKRRRKKAKAIVEDVVEDAKGMGVVN